MSLEQRREILRLREVHDGVRPGTYGGDTLPRWTKLEAGREIDKLHDRIARKSHK